MNSFGAGGVSERGEMRSAPISLSVPGLKPRVHDLLLLRAEAIRSFSRDCPAWLHVHLGAMHCWATMRRETDTHAGIPIGIRGARRNERWAGFVEPQFLLRVRTPKELRISMAGEARRRLPAFRALAHLEQSLTALPLAWGPTGSVGFELATGRPAVTEESDLDVVLFAPERLTTSDARSIWLQIAGGPGRTDPLVETPYCGFSLEEYVREDTYSIMLRTRQGRVLGKDPWAFKN
jgi:phosphoribosyl-dephospho-CoA transferase